MSKITQINYLYRDASNYKAHGEIFVEGFLSQDEKDFIFRILDDGESFIPEQVGFPPLQDELLEYEEENGDDHVWHELSLINEIDKKDCTVPDNEIWTKENLLSAFKEVKDLGGWDESFGGSLLESGSSFDRDYGCSYDSYDDEDDAYCYAPPSKLSEIIGNIFDYQDESTSC